MSPLLGLLKLILRSDSAAGIFVLSGGVGQLSSSCSTAAPSSSWARPSYFFPHSLVCLFLLFLCRCCLAPILSFFSALSVMCHEKSTLAVATFSFLVHPHRRWSKCPLWVAICRAGPCFHLSISSEVLGTYCRKIGGTYPKPLWPSKSATCNEVLCSELPRHSSASSLS